MAQLWLSVDDAADALGVSASTVRRRIKADKLESRANADGVTEVLIDTDGEDASDALNPSRELSARRRSQNSEDQLRANPWIRAARPGDALLADRRGDQRPRSDPAQEQHDLEDRNPLDTASMDETNTPTDAASVNAEQLKEHAEGQATLESAGHAFTPGDLEATPNGNEELARFQKIAGASVLLAQQQANDAREQVAIARHEAIRLRRLCYTSWAVTAAVAILCFGLTLSLGYLASSAAARADLTERILTRQHADREARAISDPARAERLSADGTPATGRSGDLDRAENRLDASTTADVRRAPFE